jgi:outer membrane protein
MGIILVAIMMIMPGDTMYFTLHDAVSRAQEFNPEIEQSAIDYAKAQAQAGQVRSAFYPSVTASGSYVYMTDVPVIQFDSIPVPFGQSENWNVQLSLQQVVFAWGKIYSAYKIADINADIAHLTLIRKKQEIRYSVTQAFYGLLVLDRMVDLSRESLTQLERHQASVEQRYKAGLVPQFDLMRARVQVANVKPQLIQVENGYKLALEGFKMLLGLDLQTEVTVEGELTMGEESFDLDDLTQYALEHRIELENIHNMMRITDLSRRIAARANLPIVVAGATYDQSKPFGFTGDEWGSSIVFNLGFQWTLFSGFKNMYAYREATLQQREADLAFDNLKKAVVLEVKQAYLTYVGAHEALLTAQENVGQADETLRLIETRYRNGLATNLEYMDVQLATMQAQTNYLSALRDYFNAIAEIKKASGKEE